MPTYPSLRGISTSLLLSMWRGAVTPPIGIGGPELEREITRRVALLDQERVHHANLAIALAPYLMEVAERFSGRGRAIPDGLYDALELVRLLEESGSHFGGLQS